MPDLVVAAAVAESHMFFGFSFWAQRESLVREMCTTACSDTPGQSKCVESPCAMLQACLASHFGRVAPACSAWFAPLQWEVCVTAGPGRTGVDAR